MIPFSIKTSQICIGCCLTHSLLTCFNKVVNLKHTCIFRSFDKCQCAWQVLVHSTQTWILSQVRFTWFAIPVTN